MLPVEKSKLYMTTRIGLMVFVIIIGFTIPVIAGVNQTHNSSNYTSTNITTQPWNATSVSGNKTITNGTAPNQTAINVTSGDNAQTAQSDENVTVTEDNKILLNETLLAPGTLTLLTPGTPDTDEGEPSIFNDTVVWVGVSEGRSAVFTYNMNSGNETVSIRDVASGSRPVVYKDRIVWTDYRNGNYDIALLNLTTRNVTYLTNDTVIQLAPSISGDNVVWEDQPDGEDIVYLCNIGTGNVTRVSDASAFQFAPVISGDNIAWGDWRNENLDIYLFRLDEGNELQITNDTADQITPAIDGDHIVWVDTRNGSGDIYLCNITTGSETRLTNESKERSDPRISQGRVIWVDHEDPAHFITLYDIHTGQQTRITGDVRYEYPQPQIYGNRIVWAGGDNGTTDIYMFTLGTKVVCPVAGFNANLTLGKPPLTVQFNDTSFGEPDTWNWDFGDGSTSRIRDPVHTYWNSGSYNVTLTISTLYCRDAVEKMAFITCGVPPDAGFAANMTSGPSPLTVAFSDTSTGVPTSWEWDFGDNSSSVEQSPVHVYEKAGKYNVSLTVKNMFGNETSTEEQYITLVSGTRAEVTTNFTGLQVISTNTTQKVVLDTRQIGNYTFNPLADNTTVEFIPPASSGLSKVVLYSLDCSGFSYSNNSTIQGNVTKTLFQSMRLRPEGFDEETGMNSSVLYSLEIPGYPEDGIIESIIWEGITPDDYAHLSTIPYYAGVLGTAYTTWIREEGFKTGPATIVMGMNSTWVELNGQRMGGTIDLISFPDNATVLIDGVAAGSTPVEVSLTEGNHTLTLTKEGYDDYSQTVWVESARNSIKIIRIADDGSIEVLNTTFSHTSAEENLDYFEAYSPQGTSKFVLTALARSGNPLQLIYMSVSSQLKAVNSYVSGGSSGGGGGGGGYSSPGSGGAIAAAATQIPSPAATLTELPDSVHESVPVPSELTDAGSEGAQGSATKLTEIPTPVEVVGNVASEVPGTSIFHILVNYVVVISAILILSIGIYLRYKRGNRG